MRQGARRLQYDGTIPKPDVSHHSLYGTLYGPISQDEGYLLGVLSNEAYTGQG